jgi:tricorn protease-like protein
MSIILTKDSSFNINNSRNILYENIELTINCSFIIENNGTKFLIRNKNGNSNIIELKNPIINISGMGVQTTGKYNIVLNSSSNILINKGEIVEFIGNKNVKIKLEDNLIGKFINIVEDDDLYSQLDDDFEKPEKHDKPFILTKEILSKLRT